jgi:hypothetical protein
VVVVTARCVLEEPLLRCRRVLGPDHPITLGAATSLTAALLLVGEREPARALGEDTLQRSRRALGPDNPITQYLTRAAGIDQLLLGDDAHPPSRPL